MTRKILLSIILVALSRGIAYGDITNPAVVAVPALPSHCYNTPLYILTSASNALYGGDGSGNCKLLATPGSTLSGTGTNGTPAVWSGVTSLRNATGSDAWPGNAATSTAPTTLGSATASASDSLTLTSWYTSSCTNYNLVVTALKTSTTAIVELQYSTDNGATWDTSTSNYVTIFQAVTTGAVTSGQWFGNAYGVAFSHASTGGVPTAIALNTNATYNGMFRFFNPASTANRYLVGQPTFEINGANRVVLNESLIYYGTSAVNGIRLLPSAGNFTSGTVSIGCASQL